MKKTLLLIFLVPYFLYSQNEKTEFLNFKLLEDKTLIWQKVFDSEITFSNLQNYFLNNDFTSNLKIKDSVFSGRSGKIKLSSLKGAPIAAYQNFDVFVKIQYKKGRYRVKVTNLQFDPTEINITSGGFGIGQSTTYSLENIAVRDNHNEIRKNKNIRNVLNTLNNDFIRLFTLKIVKEDKW